MVVLSATPSSTSMSVEYIAWSDLFDEVPISQTIPTYNLAYDANNGITKAKRR